LKVGDNLVAQFCALSGSVPSMCPTVVVDVVDARSPWGERLPAQGAFPRTTCVVVDEDFFELVSPIGLSAQPL
jgi:hypothetical protein